MKLLIERRQPADDVALLIIRLAIAAVFVYHGAQKVFGAFGGPGIEGFTAGLEAMNIPMPAVSAWLAALAEFAGGALIGIGLLTRLAAIPVIFVMGVAVFDAHWGAFSLEHNGIEYAMTLGLVLIALLLLGPGRISMDYLLFGKARRLRG